MKRRLWLLTLPALALLALGLSAQGSADASSQAAATSATITARFEIAGLPAGIRPYVFIDAPAVGGGYERLRGLGQLLAGSVSVEPGRVIEAAPVPAQRGERYMASNRFQIPSGNAALTFGYVHEYLVTVSRESHGPFDPAIKGRAAGSTSAQTQWVTAGTRFSISAAGEHSYHFSQWLIERLDGIATSSTRNPLQVTVDQPLRLTAILLGS